MSNNDFGWTDQEWELINLVPAAERKRLLAALDDAGKAIERKRDRWYDEEYAEDWVPTQEDTDQANDGSD